MPVEFSGEGIRSGLNESLTVGVQNGNDKLAVDLPELFLSKIQDCIGQVPSINGDALTREEEEYEAANWQLGF